jgi:curved DNA-binding protein CbpA
LKSARPDHYATLGLHRNCADDQIRTAYRLLAKQLHPDVNGGSPEAITQTQALNGAYETLSDPVRRREYDRELAIPKKTAGQTEKPAPNLAKEMHLRLEELLRGCKLEVRVDDPSQPACPETYELIVPPETAPGEGTGGGAGQGAA